ncbi:unnamed protein product [Zymoseptoria tritici ST99CH_3D1]|nr:unnamed protein product [Zymoseptoria tritici ST99CH_3D1]
MSQDNIHHGDPTRAHPTINAILSQIPRLSLGQRPQDQRGRNRRVRNRPRNLRQPGFEPCAGAPAPLELAQCIACEVERCAEDFPSFEQIGGICEHGSETCRSCWSSWLSAQMDAVAVDRISCAQCANPLNVPDVRHLTSDAVHERYMAVTLAATLAAAPDFHACISATCKAGQFHDEAENILTCGTCGLVQCVSCGCAFHHGVSCQEHQESEEIRLANSRDKNGDEAASEKLLKEITKTCPGCSIRIQKNESVFLPGCDHMTCSQCRHQFCWLCFAPYLEILAHGNQHHATDCMYHSANMPAQGAMDHGWDNLPAPPVMDDGWAGDDDGLGEEVVQHNIFPDELRLPGDPPGYIDLTADDDDVAIDRAQDVVEDNRVTDAINDGWEIYRRDGQVFAGRHGWINHGIFPEPPPFVWVEPLYEGGDRRGVANDDEWLDAAAYDRVLAANRDREIDIDSQQARTDDYGAWDFHEIRLPSTRDEWGINDNRPRAETDDPWGDGLNNAQADDQETMIDAQWIAVAEARENGQAADPGRASRRRRNAANRRRADAVALSQANAAIVGAQIPDAPQLWEIEGEL